MLIDVHHLLGTDHWLLANMPQLAGSNDAESARTALTAGSEHWVAYVLPFPSSADGGYSAENRYVLEAAAQDPRLRPVLALNPLHTDSREEVARLLRSTHPEIAGLVLWPILCKLDLVALSEDAWFRDLTRSLDLPVTVHVAAGNEQRIGRVPEMQRYLPEHAVALAASLPEVRFNLSHALRLSRSALEAARDLPNIWTDTSGLSALGQWHESGEQVFPADDAGTLGQLSPSEAVATLVDEFGFGERLMFGSSYPFNTWWNFDVASERRLVEEGLADPLNLRRVLEDNPRVFYSRVQPKETSP